MCKLDPVSARERLALILSRSSGRTLVWSRGRRFCPLLRFVGSGVVKRTQPWGQRGPSRAVRSVGVTDDSPCPAGPACRVLGASPGRILRTHPGTCSDVLSSQGCALAARTNSVFWEGEMFKGTVGTQMLVLALRGFGFSSALAFWIAPVRLFARIA